MTSKTTLLTAALFTFSATLQADEINDSLNEARQYYEKQQYSNAIESLNHASQLLRQKKAETLAAFLPSPLSGWEGKKLVSEAAETNLLGGGLMAKRQYTKDNAQITVQINAESPLMQSAALLLSTPLFSSLAASQTEKIGGQKAMITFNDSNNTGEIKIIVDNRFFVQINGRKITVDELKAYAKTIDYDKLSKMH